MESDLSDIVEGVYRFVMQQELAIVKCLTVIYKILGL